MQQGQADVQVANRRLADLREEVARRQSQLESLDSLYNERQASLRDTAAELAKRRGELSTLQCGLSDTLRKKADAEYQALEEQLRRSVGGSTSIKGTYAGILQQLLRTASKSGVTLHVRVLSICSWTLLGCRRILLTALHASCDLLAVPC